MFGDFSDISIQSHSEVRFFCFDLFDELVPGHGVKLFGVISLLIYQGDFTTIKS
jgi:hypothetical protein